MPNPPIDPRESPFFPADNAAALAHVSLLQGVISRLANNSASCKTWCLTLVAALLSFAGASHVPGIVTFALLPVVIFGFLDAMYLAQERAYRKLYNRLVGLMRTREYALQNVFDARAPLDAREFFGALTSWSVYPVYLGLIVAYAFAALTGWLTLLIAPAAK